MEGEAVGGGAGAAPHEIELKFLFPPSRARQIKARLFAPTRPAPRTLTSIYYDTPGRDLRRAGLTLRLREAEGRWTQTIKSAGILCRGEWERPAAGPAVDTAWIGETPAGACLAGKTPRPIFEVKVERRVVETRSALSTVQINLDQGRVTAGQRSARLVELELELKSGPLAGLLAIAKGLQREFDLEPSFAAKADHGFDLIAGGARQVRRFAGEKLTDGMTAGEGFRAVAAPALMQIAANARLLRGRPGAEAIHQTRVGARRLRSAIATFAPIVADDETPAIVAELRWLAGELDPARNLDVLLAGAWLRASRRRSDEAAVASLGARLREQRTAAHARVRAAADAPRFRAMLFDSLAWIEAGPWTAPEAPAAALRDGPIAPFARAALDGALRRTRKRGRHLAALDRPHRHRLRIAAKRLRYAAEALGPLFGHQKRARAFLGRLKSLLDSLGELNDIATGETIVGEGRAAEILIAAERAREERLIAAAAKAFRRLARAGPVWAKDT
jgi:inorganic triphosphatase YgiF